MSQPIFQSMIRGLKRRCANCGEGAILSGYLKAVPECGHCGEDFRHVRADDGPAWITILVLGHVIVPLMIYFGREDSIPVWQAAMVLSFVTLIGVYFILPRAKGIFIALIWATGATGEDMKPDETSQSQWQQTDETHNKPN